MFYPGYYTFSLIKFFLLVLSPYGLHGFVLLLSISLPTLYSFSFHSSILTTPVFLLVVPGTFLNYFLVFFFSIVLKIYQLRDNLFSAQAKTDFLLSNMPVLGLISIHHHQHLYYLIFNFYSNQLNKFCKNYIQPI